MTPPKEMFPAMLTGASHAHLNDPHFVDFAGRWVERIGRVMIVVPKSAKTQELRGIRYLRSRHEDLTLNDVLALGVPYLDNQIGTMILQDPLVVTAAGALRVFTIAQQHYLGQAWVAASRALILDETGRQGDAHEPVGIRWYCGSRNCWVHVLKHLPPNVPFVWPLWSGVVAFTCKRRVQTSRYHDVTRLNAVGVCPDQDPSELPDSTGYGLTDYNPPANCFIRS